MGNVSRIHPGHPRAKSLRTREKLAKAFESGIVVPEGLAAHGRGEAFDYLVGERTTDFARKAIEAATAALLTADRPVISVNGNVAALVPAEMVELSELVNAKLEVNLFHRSAERERLIAGHLRKHGAREVLGVGGKYATRIPEVRSDRRRVDRRGIAAADVVLVPLEDGDRTRALKRMGKFVIGIDLNPMSRTALAANITVCDNLVRAVPLMVKQAKRMKKMPRAELRKISNEFDNAENLGRTLDLIAGRLEELPKRNLGRVRRRPTRRRTKKS